MHPLSHTALAVLLSGLGKTVEVLACILSHRFTKFQQGNAHASGCDRPKRSNRLGTNGDNHPSGVGPFAKRQKTSDASCERIDCVCGAYSSDISDDGGYQGLWVCCDSCSAWLHGPCVGLSSPAAGEFNCIKCLRKRASAAVEVRKLGKLAYCVSRVRHGRHTAFSASNSLELRIRWWRLRIYSSGICLLQLEISTNAR